MEKTTRNWRQEEIDFLRHPINRKESICFSCANAYAGKCAWVDMSKQVWMHAKVKETKEGRFYIVESCKNFIPDGLRSE